MGRKFTLRYNANRIDHNLARQQQVQGTNISWYFFRPDETQTDPIYDEGSIGGGKRYHGPYLIPVYSITRVEGSIDQASEGFQTYDSVSLYLSYAQARKAGLLPPTDQTNLHLRDRFVWDGKVWKPSTIVTRNLLGNLRRFMILMQAQEVTQDEMVNDPDFQISTYAPDYYDWKESGL